MANKVILDIQNLKTVFHTQDGVVHAVNGISYALGEGETLGVVGESGCGKSVSMLSVMRLLPSSAKITADRVDFFGRNRLDFTDNEMPRVFREISQVLSACERDDDGNPEPESRISARHRHDGRAAATSRFRIEVGGRLAGRKLRPGPRSYLARAGRRHLR